jgi:serine/threonine-protein kinase
MCLACNREFQEEIQKCPHDGTALISLRQEDEWIGRTLGERYDVTELLGKGGMGVVYLARQRVIDRWVAIKMLQAELTQDEVSVKRFEQEAKAASLLNHPHLVTLHDYGITPTGQPFLVMEYLEGHSLLDIIKRQGPLSPRRAIKIFSQVSEGLGHAHHQGIVHRDLKPSNIILVEQEGDSEFVKVVDFGLAKLMPWSGKESQHLTKTGEVFGSPIYMSPEQCMGRELRPTSDIYSLGITLFESLTGKPPFKGANSIATASKHMSEPPPRFTDIRPDLDLPEVLETVVLKTLAKDPAARYQNMSEFKDALQGAAAATRQAAAANISASNSVQALGSTAAIPLHKQEQDKLRTSANALRSIGSEEEPKKDPPIKLIAGIAAAVAAVAIIGAVAFIALRPAAATVSGVVYYLSYGANKLEVLDDHSNRVWLALNPTVVEQLAGKGLTTENCLLGNRATFQTNAQKNVALSVTLSTPDENITSTAWPTLKNFLDAIGGCDYERAVESMFLTSRSPAEAKQSLQHDFPLDDIIRVGHSAGNLAAVADGRPDFRPAEAIKVESADHDTVVFLVKKDAYLRNRSGFWRFRVTEGKLVYDDANEHDWDKY